MSEHRPENYGRLLKKSVNQLTRDFDRFAALYGLTGTQMSVIDFLSTQPQLQASQRAIEREFDIQRSTTTVMLQRMERKGLLIRVTNPDDARQKNIRLTKEAQGLVNVVTEYIDTEQNAFLHAYGPRRVAEFTQMLNFFVRQRHQISLPSSETPTKTPSATEATEKDRQ